MPNYDFECKNNHIFEANVSYEEMKQGISCIIEGCKSKAEVVYLSPRASRIARNFEPTLLYKTKNGEIFMPGRSNPDHLPKKLKDSLQKRGYKETTISNFREYESFQREQTKLLQSKQEEDIYCRQQLYDNEIKQQIDDLKRGSPVRLANGEVIYPPKLEDLSPANRRLAEYAIEKAIEHKIKGGDISPRIDAFENDRSFYRDADVAWKKKY